MNRFLSIGLFAASIASTAAQIASQCNPLNTTTPCPADPALGTSHTWNMGNDTLQNTDVWNVTNGRVSYSGGAAQFVIAEKGQAPTIRSNFYFMWGGASISLKASSGQGIVSSLTYLSDDLDEIDWEWIGGNNTHVQTNYFGKGNVTVYDRAVWVPVHDPQGTYHNYSINWSSAELQWLIDGNVVRSLPYAQADDHGNQFPQTPLDVRMGIWAGGDASLGNTNYTVQWAGGAVDYSQAPFTMSVQTVQVNDGTQNVSQYTYGDKTGKWQSIKTTAGNSTAVNSINAPPPESVVQKFNDLSTATKIGIVCAVGGVVLILAVLCTFCCLRQRKAGRKEREVADADWDRANSEMLAYRQQVQTPRTPVTNPFSDSKTDLTYPHRQQYGGEQYHGEQYNKEYNDYNMSPLSPNPQYAPHQYR